MLCLECLEHLRLGKGSSSSSNSCSMSLVDGGGIICRLTIFLEGSGQYYIQTRPKVVWQHTSVSFNHIQKT